MITVRPEGSNLEEGGVVVVVVVGRGGGSTPLLLSPYAVMPNRMELFFFRMHVILTTGSTQHFYGVRIDAGERNHFIMRISAGCICSETPCASDSESEELGDESPKPPARGQ